MRQMATVKRIDEINPIPDADAIEVAVVGGWKVVVKKGEYSAGDLAVYCEIDSWIPHDLAPFLSKGKEPREYEGIKGERLRTIKLRKQISQGLLLPVELGIGGFPFIRDIFDNEIVVVKEGDDVSEHLNITKYDPPVPAQLGGVAKGNFPSEIPKTDQERVQNVMRDVQDFITSSDSEFEVSEKMEGSSMTCYLIDGVFGVCSRNLDLKETEGNTFWDTARQLNIEEKMRSFGLDNIALQGELIGPGVQKNIYNLKKHEYRVFDMYDIVMGQYATHEARVNALEKMGIDSVPILAVDSLGKFAVTSSELIEFADGASVIGTNPAREGLVFKCVQGQYSFKAISNKYLLKEK